MKKTALFLLFFLLNANLYSQEITESPRFLKSILDYRLEILRNIDCNIEIFNKSISNWFKVEKCENELFDLLRNINLNSKTYGMHYSYYKAHILESFKESELAAAMNEFDLFIIHDNSDFFEMLSNHFIKPSFPYQITLTNFQKEIEFLNLKKNESYGEMDLSLGTNALFYAMYEDSLKITVFVPNDLMANYVKQKFDHNRNRINKENINIMKFPEAKDIGKNDKVNSLIVRNIFHHGKSQSEQLKYFKSLLKPNGQLFIINHFNTNSNCSSKMDLKETIKTISEFGLKLEDQQTIYGNTFLKFSLREN